MRKPPFGVPAERNWRVEAEEVLSENPYFRLLRSRVRMPSGAEATYFNLDFRKLAVGVVPRRPGEILLIRQYRFLVDQFVWAIPSGGVEKGEDLEAAARRELREETGYQEKRLARLHAYYPSYGCGNQEFHLFEAEVEGSAPARFDSNEVLDVRWHSHAEVKRMALGEEILDGLSLAPLLFLCAREAW
jgi:ADP-ribose diphosphatase